MTQINLDELRKAAEAEGMNLYHDPNYRDWVLREGEHGLLFVDEAGNTSTVKGLSHGIFTSIPEIIAAAKAERGGEEEPRKVMAVIDSWSLGIPIWRVHRNGLTLAYFHGDEAAQNAKLMAARYNMTADPPPPPVSPLEELRQLCEGAGLTMLCLDKQGDSYMIRWGEFDVLQVVPTPSQILAAALAELEKRRGPETTKQ